MCLILCLVLPVTKRKIALVWHAQGTAVVEDVSHAQFQSQVCLSSILLASNHT